MTTLLPAAARPWSDDDADELDDFAQEIADGHASLPWAGSGHAAIAAAFDTPYRGPNDDPSRSPDSTRVHEHRRAIELERVLVLLERQAFEIRTLQLHAEGERTRARQRFVTIVALLALVVAVLVRTAIA